MIAIIELVEYRTTTTISKPSHAGDNCILESTLEKDKMYKIKFTGSDSEYRIKHFKNYIKAKGGYYEWLEEAVDMEDYRYYPRCSDDTVVPEGYSCLCQFMTEYLLNEGFRLHSIGNILHVFELKD